MSIKLDADLRRTVDIVKEYIGRFEPDSEAMRRALSRIGNLAVAMAKRNAQNAKPAPIFDSGNLINATRWEFVEGQSTILVGTFGVKYARINEFGTKNFTDRQRRAMFANLRERGGPPRPSRGVIRGNTWVARPYLGPAVLDNKAHYIDIMREELSR